MQPRTSNLVLFPGTRSCTALRSSRSRRLSKAASSGDLLRLDEPRQPRAASDRRQRLWDLAPHDFSILRYWLGQLPSEVVGITRAASSEHARRGLHNMRFATGAIAHLELSWLSPSKLRRTAIIGSERMLIYDDSATSRSGSSIRAPSFRPETFGEFRMSYRTGTSSRHTSRRQSRWRSRWRLLRRNPRRRATLVRANRARRGERDRGRRTVDRRGWWAGHGQGIADGRRLPHRLRPTLRS